MNKTILCFVSFVCKKNAKLNPRAARNKELAFITEGFSNWKKALTRFKEHHLYDCHKLAIDYQMNFPTTCENVLEMSNDAGKSDGVSRPYLVHQSYRIFAISCPARTGHAG